MDLKHILAAMAAVTMLTAVPVCAAEELPHPFADAVETDDAAISHAADAAETNDAALSHAVDAAETGDASLSHAVDAAAMQDDALSHAVDAAEQEEVITTMAATEAAAETTTSAEHAEHVVTSRNVKLTTTDQEDAAEADVALLQKEDGLYLQVTITGTEAGSVSTEELVEAAVSAYARSLDDYFRVTGENAFTIRSYAPGGAYTDIAYEWDGTAFIKAADGQQTGTTTAAQTTTAVQETTTAADTTTAAGTTTAQAATTTATETKAAAKGEDDTPKTSDSASALPVVLAAVSAVTGAAAVVRRKQD